MPYFLIMPLRACGDSRTEPLFVRFACDLVCKIHKGITGWSWIRAWACFHLLGWNGLSGFFALSIIENVAKNYNKGVPK